MAISIKELLDSLAEDSRNNNLKQWCEQLYVYYKENDRHSYAEITEYIFSNKGGIEYVRELLPLLKDIQHLEKDKNVKLKMGKLIDHMQLEVIRYDQLVKIIQSSVENNYTEMMNSSVEGVNDALKDVKKQTEENNSLLEKQKAISTENEKMLKEQSEQMSRVSEMAQEAESKVTAVQTENVAILGIFASIVFAFTGLMTFTNSVLENIGNASAYRVVVICLMIGIIFIDVIGVLITGVKRVVYWKTPKNSGRRICTTWKECFWENAVWIVGNVVLIIILVFTVYKWETSTEKQMQDMSRQNYIQDLKNAAEKTVSENSAMVETIVDE